MFWALSKNCQMTEDVNMKELSPMSRDILNNKLKKILNAIGIKMYLHFPSYFSMEENTLKDVAKFAECRRKPSS